LDGNIDAKVFDIECKKSVMGVDMKFYEFVGQAIGIGDVVEVVNVQVLVQDDM